MEEVVIILWLRLNKEDQTDQSDLVSLVPGSEYVFFNTQRSMFKSKNQA